MLRTVVSEETWSKPTPIQSNWVLNGNPIARSSSLFVSDDGLFSCGRWECTEGQFTFRYFCDEIVEILEGTATIQIEGQTRRLVPGDVAYFSQGSTAIWTVHGYVKKLAIFRSKRRSLAGRVLHKLKSVVLQLIRRKPLAAPARAD